MNVTKLLSSSMLAVALGTSAWAGGPSVSVPSTPDASGKIVVKGSALAAYTNVTVRFSSAQLTPIDSVAQVAGNGTFKVEFQPPINGSYAVVVYDSAGQKIGQGNFGYFR